MRVRRFVVLSVVMAAVGALLGRVVFASAVPSDSAGAYFGAMAAASCVSTSGWSVVLIGLGRDPRQAPLFFMAGTLVKMTLIGMTVATVVLAGVASIEPFLIYFVAGFCVFGLAQLVWVARAAAGAARIGGANGPSTRRSE